MDDLLALVRDLKGEDKTAARPPDLVRLVVDEVMLRRGDEIVAHGCFKSGVWRTLRLPRPRPRQGWRLPKVQAQVIQRIDHWLNAQTDGDVAAERNGGVRWQVSVGRVTYGRVVPGRVRQWRQGRTLARGARREEGSHW